MRLVELRLRTSVRRSLYAIVALAWCSGTSFYCLRRWFQVEGDFGPQAHPWQQTVLSLHGATAFLMLMAIGAMGLSHIPLGWRTGRSRVHGVLLACAAGTMVLTAWALYYLGHETLRAWVAWAHLCTGLAVPGILGLHIWLGRRKSARLRSNKLTDSSSR